MADIPPNRLFAALAALAPGRVLQMGSRLEVQQGINGFASKVVHFDSWTGTDQARFLVGSAPVTVTVDESGKLLSHCGFCDRPACPHVVAVMATCVHVVRGKSSFTTSRILPRDFEDVRAQLIGEHAARAVPAQSSPNSPISPRPAGKPAPGKSGASSHGNGNGARRAAAGYQPVPAIPFQPDERSALERPKIRIVQNGLGRLDVVCSMPRASLSMRGNASYCSPSALRLLPAAVRDLFSVPVMHPGELEQDFFQWAGKNIGCVEIVIDALESGEAAPVEKVLSATPMVMVSHFRRDAAIGKVEKTCVVAPAMVDLDAKGTNKPIVPQMSAATTNFHRIGRSIVYLPEQRALAWVMLSYFEEGTPVDLSDHVISKIHTISSQIKNRPFATNTPEMVSIATFNQTAIDFGPPAEPEKVLVRYFDGDEPEPVAPVPAEIFGSILAEPRAFSGGRDRMVLSPRLVSGSPVPGAIDEAAECLEEAEEHFSMQTRRLSGFRAALGEFLLASSKKERQTVVKEYVTSLGNASRHRYEAEREFTNLEKKLSADRSAVIAREAAGAAGVETPAWISLDAHVPAFRLLAIIYKHFPKFEFDYEIDDDDDAYEKPVSSYIVEVADWKAGLPMFAGELAKNGFEFVVSGRKVERVSLDLKIRAEGGSDVDPDGASFEPGRERIDWFALRPEVLCGDSEVPPEKWMDIIKSGALTGGDGDGSGILQVVDPESLERFALFLRAGAGMATGRGATSKDGLVRIPRLQIFDWIHLKSQGITVELPAEEEAMINSLLSGTPSQPAPMPGNVKAELRPYQEAGYRWLAFLYQHRFGAVLADDMGLGKTLQAITLFAALESGLLRRPAKLPHLAVLPPSLVFNWQAEIARFTPHLKVHEYTGAKRSIDDIADADVVLTTYELARRDIEKLEAVPFDVIIFDEAQTAKNISAARSKAIRRLSGRFRLCLTGTPLENHVGEYYAILDLALPGLLGEPEDFREAMKSKSAENGVSARHLRRAHPFVLRRTKEKVLKDLPPKVESDIFLDLDRAQKEYYTRTVAEIRKEVANAFKHKPRQQAGIVALTALMRLRQICVAPSVIDPSIKGDSPKVAYLVGKLLELHEEGHAALVFSQFTRVLDVVEKQLGEAGLKFLRLDGKTPQKMRKKRVEDFQSDDGPGIFLISLKAGGAGLNLTRAAYVFHLDPWWNPAVERQASDRAHRIGQKQTVFIHRILMRGTIEEKMMVLKARKQELYDEIMGAAEAGAERVHSRKSPMITQEDIGFLLEK